MKMDNSEVDIPGRTYHRRYGYPWVTAIVAESWWRLEHLPYRGGDGGLCGHIARRAYGNRKAAERRGYKQHSKTNAGWSTR